MIPNNGTSNFIRLPNTQLQISFNSIFSIKSIEPGVGTIIDFH